MPPTDSTETLASRADKRYRLARAVKKPVKHVSTARKGMAEPPVSAVSAACDTLLAHVGGMDKAAIREEVVRNSSPVAGFTVVPA